MAIFLLLGLAAFPSVLTGTSSGTFKFTRKPESREVNNGSSLAIPCNVNPDNITGIQYSWYRFVEFDHWEDIITEGDKSSVLNDKTSSSLHIGSADANDIGYYMCKVSTSNYTIFSDTAYINVLYFEESSLVKKDQSLKDAVEFIECNVSNSNPLTPITWYRIVNGEEEEIMDKRMFVIPTTENESQEYPEKAKRGSLAIINVIRDDEGVYRCTTKYKGKKYSLTEVNVTVGTVSSSDDESELLFMTKTKVHAVKGSAVSFFCAFKGKTLETVGWWFRKEDGGKEIRLNGGDSIELSDFNRHLLLRMVTEDNAGGYYCREDVEKGASEAGLELKVYTEDDYHIEVLQPPISFNLKPNLYQPNKLSCIAKESGFTKIRFLKNSLDSNYTIGRIKENRTATNNGGKQLSLIMDQPNESDLGVYQCLLNNDNGKQLVEQTAYITLEQDQIPFHRTKPPEYLYVNQSKKVDEAEEYCKKAFVGGHLVSIMSAEENQKVQEFVNLQKDPSVEFFWIGLTKEVPIVAGFWRWVYPGDPSTVYSNWEEGKPYDRGSREYAIMSSSSGKWIDVTNYEERTFVCKRYVTVCPSIYRFYDKRVSVRGWETADSFYNVGDSVRVYCRDVVTKINIKTVFCQPNGTFYPPLEQINCPQPPELPSFAGRVLVQLSLLASVVAVNNVY